MESKAILLDQQTAIKIINGQNEIKALLRELTNKGRKEYLTHKEVMQVLKCSYNTVDTYVSLGYFNCYQVGGKGSKKTYKRSEIENYLDSKAN